MNPNRPISPSATTSMPQSACCFTVSATALLMRLANAAVSNGSPRSFAWIISNKSGGRGRLPTWVLRIRSVLCFISALLAEKKGSAYRIHGRWRRPREGLSGQHRFRPHALQQLGPRNCAWEARLRARPGRQSRKQLWLAAVATRVADQKMLGSIANEILVLVIQRIAICDPKAFRDLVFPAFERPLSLVIVHLDRELSLALCLAGSRLPCRRRSIGTVLHIGRVRVQQADQPPELFVDGHLSSPRLISLYRSAGQIRAPRSTVSISKILPFAHTTICELIHTSGSVLRELGFRGPLEAASAVSMMVMIDEQGDFGATVEPG